MITPDGRYYVVGHQDSAEVSVLDLTDPKAVPRVVSLREPGRKTARVHYGADGFVAHHISDIWGFTTPGDRPALDRQVLEYLAAVADGPPAACGNVPRRLPRTVEGLSHSGHVLGLSVLAVEHEHVRDAPRAASGRELVQVHGHSSSAESE